MRSANSDWRWATATWLAGAPRCSRISTTFSVLDLQLRHGFGQGRRHLMQRQHGLLAGQDGVGVLQQGFPVMLHGAAFRLRTAAGAAGRPVAGSPFFR
jgi:hypothetical protein